jgi:hypothetical protein
VSKSKTCDCAPVVIQTGGGCSTFLGVILIIAVLSWGDPDIWDAMVHWLMRP